MESNISDEDIDALLQESGFREAPDVHQTTSIKQQSLDQLLQEIMAANTPSAASLPQETALSIPTHKENHKRTKIPLTPIWLSLSILGVFLFGGALGFYWGKRDPLPLPDASPLTSIHSQLTTLIEEVRKLSQWVDLPLSPAEEVIVPLQPSDEKVI